MSDPHPPARRTAPDPEDVAAPAVSQARPAMRLRVIACEVLARPLYLSAARSRNVVDIQLLRRGLHDTPPVLREQLQAAIDAAAAGDPPCDAVALAYGLCGGATAGIVASGVPLVLPRAHDCITLFLGSRRRYLAEFTAHPGTYWYAPDQVERVPKGAEAPGLLGIGATSDEELASVYAGYVATYGRENADYLMEAMGAWRSHYDRAAYIDTGLGDPGDAERLARNESERRGWRFERLAGDLVLLRRLLDGDWAGDFLVLQPGERLAMSYDEDVVRAAEPATGAVRPGSAPIP
jgi:hypothetical protein